MQRLPLGRTDIVVSDWCLGTMTYGNQTPESDAHNQIDMALDAGINFLDTAEAYPVNPIKAETIGHSEEVIGNWIAKSGRRDDVVVATKVAGNNPGWVRGGKGFDGNNIRETVEASLKRLQTDVIDLYQLHWPDRGSYMFRQNWTFDPSGQNRAQTLDHMMGVLTTLGALVAEGKIRAVGTSNESAWGMTKWVDLAESAGLPRMASVQNEYSLLCRMFDTDLGEPEWDKTTFPELGDAAVNPYHERAQVGLAPLSDPVRGRRFAMIHPSGILMSQGDEITHLLPLADAQLQMERALTQTRAVLPVLHSDAGAEDLFDPTGYTIGLGCSVNNVMTFWQADGASPALVNLFCELSEEAGSLDVWIVVPPVQT